MVEEFLIQYRAVITNAVELMAALCGSYYLKKEDDDRLRVFVYYLWMTFAFELVGNYGYFMSDNYDNIWFIALKNSLFCSNIWLYNVYAYLAIGMISIFYYNLMKSFATKITILCVIIGYSIFSIIFYLVTDAFFRFSMPYQLTIGVGIICLYVLLYFLQLIKSDNILEYFKLPSVYISIGLLLWYLCIIPLFLFNVYFYSISTEFGKFRILLLLIINICTYSWFSFGFLYPLYRKGLLRRKK